MADEVSYLEMSDEEIANIDPSTIGQEAQATEEQPVENTDLDPVASDEAEEGDDQPGAGAESEADPQGQAEDAGDTPGAGVDEGSGAASDPLLDPSSEKTPEPESQQQKSEESAIDYKAEYEKLTAPFKANGREIQVRSVDDAVALMQMGANYNKKMAALKPNLKLMKLLENNGLLSEEKLSYLIDLEKKNPDAIGKLLKDSGLDPLDLDTSKAGDYKPTRHSVDDREIELDTVLEDLRDSPTYAKTLDIVGTQWDGPSKKIVADSPQLLKVIDSHVQSGIYDTIIQEMERERIFGRLKGLSDIEAYRQVGDSIAARGGFDHLGSQGQQTPKKPVVVPPKPKMGDEDERRARKLAAGGSKASVPSKPAADFNPLALSDDEFGKIVNTKFL